jgi:hypothetical protein
VGDFRDHLLRGNVRLEGGTKRLLYNSAGKPLDGYRCNSGSRVGWQEDSVHCSAVSWLPAVLGS